MEVYDKLKHGLRIFSDNSLKKLYLVNNNDSKVKDKPFISLRI